MQTTTEQNPPASAQADMEEMILARVHIPKELFPAECEGSYFVLLPILAIEEAIRLDLAAHGLAARVNACGTLNSGLVMVNNTNRPACLAALHSLFDRLQLWDWYSIYYFDERENFLRAVHVGIGGSANYSMDDFGAEMKSHRASFESTKAVLAMVREHFKKKQAALLIPPLEGAQNPS